MIHDLATRWLAGAGLIFATVCCLTVIASLTIGGITSPDNKLKSTQNSKSRDLNHSSTE